MKNSAPINSLRLTPRDIQIILSVYRYDGIFSYQIRRRFWGKNGHPLTFLERLGQLIRCEYLRARPMDSTTGRGSGQRLITIGKSSIPLLKEVEGLTQEEIRWLRHSIVPAFWRHDAGVRDFRMSAELAAEAHPMVSSLVWTNECEYKRNPIKVEVSDPGKPERLITIPLEPDGSLTLELTSGQAKQHFLEWDCDTEQAPSMVKPRLRGYLQHIGSSAIPVLWVVPDRKRAEKLTLWMQQEADSLLASPSIFAIATKDQIDERRILSHPIWQVVGQQEFSTLLPANTEGVNEP